MVPTLQLQHLLLVLHMGLRVIPGTHIRGPKRRKHCLGKGSEPNRAFLHNLGSQCIYREVLPALSPSLLPCHCVCPPQGPLLPPVNSLGTTTNKIISTIFSLSLMKSHLRLSFGFILTQRKIISCLISYLISCFLGIFAFSAGAPRDGKT